MLEIITGDLLNSDCKFIVHQTNCLTDTIASGLAYYLFQKYPYADCYKDRTCPAIPGTINVRGNGQDQKYIINLHGQYYPGGVLKYFENHELDGIKAREKYFHKGLLAIAKIQNLESVAFNYLIGCGIAGGNWDHYYKMIDNFTKYVEKTFGTKVYIVQREKDKQNGS